MVGGAVSSGCSCCRVKHAGPAALLLQAQDRPELEACALHPLGIYDDSLELSSRDNRMPGSQNTYMQGNSDFMTHTPSPVTHIHQRYVDRVFKMGYANRSMLFPRFMWT